jgi:hypothetical protein
MNTAVSILEAFKSLIFFTGTLKPNPSKGEMIILKVFRAKVFKMGHFRIQTSRRIRRDMGKLSGRCATGTQQDMFKQEPE